MRRQWLGRRWLRVLPGLLMGGLLGVAAPPAPLQASSVSEYTIASWLRVDPLHSGTVFVGGLRSFVLGQSPDSPAPPTFSCQELASRSFDGGKTWRNLPISAVDTSDNDPLLAGTGCLSPGPFLVAPGGQELFFLEGNLDSLHSNGVWIERSGDGGLHWSRPLGQVPEEGSEFSAEGGLSLSPFTPLRVYGYLREGGGGVITLLLRSDDGGAHFHYLFTDPQFKMDTLRFSDYQPITTLQDPSSPSIVYFAFTNFTDTHPMAWARSRDGGKTWHLLNLTPLLPPGALTLNSATANTPPGWSQFAHVFLSTDARFPGRLVAQVTGPGTKADRRFLSANHGQTWQAVSCPGDLRGVCPTQSLQGVFGRGWYGFYPDGIHAFAGTGSAGPRLALSDHLPCRGSALLDAEGGGTPPGAPAYVLCQTPVPGQIPGPDSPAPLSFPPVYSGPLVAGIVYRSTDGHTWRRLHPEAAWAGAKAPPLVCPGCGS